MTFLNSRIGIFKYQGAFTTKGTIPVAEAKTGSVITNGTQLRGTGTKFLSEIQIGQYVYGSNNEIREIVDIGDDTHAVLKSAFTSNLATYPVVGATNASPIQISTPIPHNLTTGQTVVITGVGGNTAANGTWVVTVVNPNNFTLNGSTGNGAFTSGGTVGIGLMVCDSGNFRRIRIKNSGGAAGILTGVSFPDQEIEIIQEEAGLAPINFDATGTTFLISTME